MGPPVLRSRRLKVQAVVASLPLPDSPVPIPQENSSPRIPSFSFLGRFDELQLLFWASRILNWCWLLMQIKYLLCRVNNTYCFGTLRVATDRPTCLRWSRSSKLPIVEAVHFEPFWLWRWQCWCTRDGPCNRQTKRICGRNLGTLCHPSQEGSYGLWHPSWNVDRLGSAPVPATEVVVGIRISRSAAHFSSKSLSALEIAWNRTCIWATKYPTKTQNYWRQCLTS